VTFVDAAEALVQADIDHYDGAHLPALLGPLSNRGLIDVSNYAPVVVHEPLGTTEQLGGTRTLRVQVIPISSSVSTLSVFWRHGNGPEQSLSLTSAGDQLYEAELPLPAVADTVHYWLRLTDSANRVVVVPTLAPSATYSFVAGRDTTLPVVVHTPITGASIADWPPEVRVEISDNLAVAGARVEYQITYPDSPESFEGVFDLVQEVGTSIWTGRFDASLADVRGGSRVLYRVRAVDQAAIPNEAWLPLDGFFEFGVVAEGVLARFDADSPVGGIFADGAWQSGTPSYGVISNPSGGAIWATGLAGSYPSTGSRSILEFPPLDLTGIDAAWLLFRHWYDTEHDGSAEPGTFRDESLWDGANVKVSTDGGFNWTVLEPVGGYDGRIKATQANPMSGEEAWGGYSYGWRQAVVQLPSTGDVRIALEFATDGDNSDEAISFAGWYVDELLVTTDLPDDASLPTVVEDLAPLVVLPSGEGLPSLVVRTGDDVGVVGAVATWNLAGPSGTGSGSSRLSVAAGDVFRFSGSIQPGRALEPGDRITYRLTITDTEGNEISYPTASADPFAFEVLRIQASQLAADARATGGWRRNSSGWQIENTDGALILPSRSIPPNATQTQLVLAHRFIFGAGSGGRVMLSYDDGATWSRLEPDGGYPGTLNGIPAFVAGEVETGRLDVFALGGYAGRNVQLRLETDTADDGDAWIVDEAKLEFRTIDDEFEATTEVVLHANFPDPFGAHTNISFSLPTAEMIGLSVYDVLGRRVATLVDGVAEAGTHVLTFDGSELASGVYLLRLRIGSEVRTERMVIAH
jgi:hypothetical protein